MFIERDFFFRHRSFFFCQRNVKQLFCSANLNKYNKCLDEISRIESDWHPYPIRIVYWMENNIDLSQTNFKFALFYCFRGKKINKKQNSFILHQTITKYAIHVWNYCEIILFQNLFWIVALSIQLKWILFSKTICVFKKI